MLKNDPKCSKRLQNVPKCSKNSLKWSQTVYYCPKPSKMLPNAPKCSKMLQNAPIINIMNKMIIISITNIINIINNMNIIALMAMAGAISALVVSTVVGGAPKLQAAPSVLFIASPHIHIWYKQGLATTSSFNFIININVS